MLISSSSKLHFSPSSERSGIHLRAARKNNLGDGVTRRNTSSQKGKSIRFTAIRPVDPCTRCDCVSNPPPPTRAREST